jgi:hypothetical protein
MSALYRPPDKDPGERAQHSREARFGFASPQLNAFEQTEARATTEQQLTKLSTASIRRRIVGHATGNYPLQE